ncbi:hypothetical protein FQV27_12785 [Paracoccus aurantiacus]|uniref:Uncharacterized protein n=1 Tax=Paracoccus aurantiacus TaxID=2599412 RepID=A0A5C6S074_9RHOB|nr:hypothetical protein [Paracoccus aurantiacus]TXB68058.1 hypothetical protein FQV27_12785 [Paracoccus aurantiacus]
MTLLAGILAAGLAGAPGLPEIIAEIDRLVLSGRQMPAAFMLDVRRLPDAGDRMQALVYLRRAGLLTGSAQPLDGIVFQRAPVAAPNAAEPSNGE